jgi:hypothetical protein
MANTNKGRKISISTTSTPVDLTGVQFGALIWTEVKNVGSIGETGTQTNIVSYDELTTDVTQKQKGISNAGDPVIECARNPTDPGQIAMRAAALTKFYYGFKIEDADGVTSNSIFYQRGLVTGPVRPGGRNEDFILENYTLGLVQREVLVDPVMTFMAPEGREGGPDNNGGVGDGVGPDRVPQEVADQLTLDVPTPPPGAGEAAEGSQAQIPANQLQPPDNAPH